MRLHTRTVAPIFICVLMSTHTPSYSQQTPDTLFDITFRSEANSHTIPSVIYIDQMHHNLHTLEGGFSPFAKLAKKDGFIVNAFTDYDQLKEADIVIVANALNEKNIGNWLRPVHPAFEKDEIERITNWVNGGGKLLLIADHMPFAGAANDLANAFGFNFCDGFAQLSEQENRQDVFSIQNGRMLNSTIADGTYGVEIDRITTFTGSSFTIPEDAEGILQFGKNDRCLKPEVAWQFNSETERQDIEGNYQGAILEYGQGKVAVFGEAAMFTAQSITQNGNTFKIGFNSPHAANNVEFIRNVLNWLREGKSERAQISTVEKEILEVNRKMEEAFNKKDYGKVAEFYSSDAVMVGNMVEVIGIDNIIPYWRKFSGADEWVLENIEIKELGKGYALQRGFSNIYYTKPDGTKGNSRSIFSLVWKNTDQGWKMMLDHFSPRN